MDESITDKLLTLIDDEGRPYLVFNPFNITTAPARPVNATEEAYDVVTFLSETLPVRRYATGIFASDLTDRDDVILAISSLFLILVIEGTLTTILVRTRDGKASNFGFSIKQFLELAREFKWANLIRGKNNRHEQRKSKIRPRLLLIAALILLFTFVLEVVILILSSPSFVNVYNTDRAFELLDAVNPDWNQVRRNRGAAIYRPCTAVTMENVEQDNNIINPCLTTSDSEIVLSLFSRATEPVSFNFTSDIHEFGADHVITIGDQSQSYLSRCYFRLGENRNRVMSMRRQMFNEEVRISFMHRQFVAYLFNMYERDTADTSMDFDKLNNTEFEFQSVPGPLVKIIQINKRARFREVTSTRHTTTFEGVIPQGKAALQLAQAVLKGASAVSIGPPSQFDLQMGSGNTAGDRALMWRERARDLNWLSLNLMLAGAGVVFLGLRAVLKPVGTAEIAEYLVIKAVGAREGRPPVYMANDEKEYFKLEGSGGRDWDSLDEYSDVNK